MSGDVLSCPVCERKAIPCNTSRCPQCDADLECFRLLEGLEEPMAGWTGAREKTYGFVVQILMVMVGVMVGLFFYHQWVGRDFNGMGVSSTEPTMAAPDQSQAFFKMVEVISTLAEVQRYNQKYFDELRVQLKTMEQKVANPTMEQKMADLALESQASGVGVPAELTQPKTPSRKGAMRSSRQGKRGRP